MDGTLLNSGPGVMRCMKLALAHFGIPEPPFEKLRLCVGPPLPMSFRNLFLLPEDQVEEAITVFRAEYNARGIFESSLYPGIPECLKELSESGYHVAVASSKVQKACYRVTDHFGVTEYFYDIAGSIPETGLEKKVDVINSFFERHPNLKKEETVLIGDTHFDADGAKAAGVGFALVTWGFEDPKVLQELKDLNALAVFEAADEIVPWLNSQRN